MASLFTENFEGGTNGAAVTSANTNFGSITGSALTFTSSTTPPQGTLAMQVAAAAGVLAYGQSTVTATGVLFRRLYVNPPATVTGSFDMIATRGSNNPRNRLRLNTDRTVSLLNGSTVVWTSTTALPSGQWSRVEMRIDNPNAQQQARLYVGANPHTTAITEDSGNRTYNQGTIDTIRLGQLNSNTTASTTIFYDAVADDGATWPGPIASSTPTISGTVTLAVSLSGAVAAVSNSISGTITLPLVVAGSVEAVIPLLPRPPSPFHEWVMFSRDTTYSAAEALPILSATIVKKWLGVSKAVIDTPLNAARLASLQPGAGVLIYRDGVLEFTGLVAELNPVYGANAGDDVIHVQAVGDEQHLADRLTLPDPSRAADDQIVSDRWAFTGVASTAMQRLISDQAGPTCRADRQVSGLVLGDDPGLGISRTWTGLFNSVLDQLTVMSVASGANLGVRLTGTSGQLRADIVAPNDLSDSVIFSTDLTNLAGIDYRLGAPTATHALSAGQGNLHLRTRKLAVTTDPAALQWGRQVWSYIDRRDTTDLTELTKAATDELASGAPTVSLAITLLDSDAARYGRDWGLGDIVTVYVGRPGEAKSAVVSDVVREIELSIDNSGAETIRPAIGSYDATADKPTLTQKQISAVGQSLAGLIARTG